MTVAGPRRTRTGFLAPARVCSCRAHLRTRSAAGAPARGREVRLWWLPTTKSLTVSVRDARRDLEFEVAVQEAKPLDVFYHPYAYAHSRGIVVEDEPESLAA